jgi:hypothetical protein
MPEILSMKVLFYVLEFGQITTILRSGFDINPNQIHSLNPPFRMNTKQIIKIKKVYAQIGERRRTISVRFIYK